MTAKQQVRRLMPRTVRQHRIWTGPLRGRRLVASWHDYPGAILGYTERPLLRWLAGHVEPRQTWIDVGAHYGYTALALCDLVGPEGRVFAFEPVLSTAGYLSSTRRLNDLEQLTIAPFGLAACGELQPLDVPLVRGMAEHRAGAGTLATDRMIQVAFDQVWPSLARVDTKIHGAKIDVQGMEVEVLMGMQRSLMASRPVLVVEVHAGVDRTLLRHVLSAMGYREPVPIVPGASLDDPDSAADSSYCVFPQ